MTSVKITGLNKTYAKAAAPTLRDLSLTIPSGSLTALLGPSGSGKTTLLKIIAGLDSPSSGEIAIGDQAISGRTPGQIGAVMVFQNPLLFPHMSVAQNVAFGLAMRHLPKAEIAAKVEDMLALVQLPGMGQRRPAQLSGGQAQRVALARALILNPRVLLLDEPLSNLDASLRAEMRDLIRSLQRATGITTLVVTHDQQEAVVLADQIALILDGRLQQFGPPEAFFNRPSSAAVARFFGGVNFIPVTGQDGNFTSAIGPLTAPQNARHGQGTLTIRPESIRLGPAPLNSLMATLVSKTYLGTQTRLTLQIGDTMLQAITNPDAAATLAIGAQMAINLPPQSLWLLP